jgi:excisionase family DNA binding protein
MKPHPSPTTEPTCDQHSNHQATPVGRFLTLGQVSEILNISPSQTYSLVRSGSLPAIKIGGRGQWRVERTQLETYIERMYDETRRFVKSHPLGRDEPLPPD